MAEKWREQFGKIDELAIANQRVIGLHSGPTDGRMAAVGRQRPIDSLPFFENVAP